MAWPGGSDVVELPVHHEASDRTEKLTVPSATVIDGPRTRK